MMVLGFGCVVPARSLERRGGFEGLGGPGSRAGWDPPLIGDAQKGGGPVDSDKHGLMEVASP